MFKETDESEFIEYQIIDVQGLPLSEKYPLFRDVQSRAIEMLAASNWTDRVFILVIDKEYGPIGDQEVFVA